MRRLGRDSTAAGPTASRWYDGWLTVAVSKLPCAPARRLIGEDASSAEMETRRFSTRRC
jgi:hypothetical protein